MRPVASRIPISNAIRDLEVRLFSNDLVKRACIDERATPMESDEIRPGQYKGYGPKEPPPLQRRPLFSQKRKRAQRILFRVLIVVALLVGIKYLLFDVLIPFTYWSRAETLIEEFEKNPTEKGAESLVYLLDRKLVPRPLGNRALVALASPTVEMREAYPAGDLNVPMVNLHWKFDGEDRRQRYKFIYRFGPGNRRFWQESMYPFQRTCKISTWDANQFPFREAGQHLMGLDYTLAVEEYTYKESLWQWLQFESPLSYEIANNPHLYAATDSLDYVVNVVPPDALPPFPRTRSKRLDEEVIRSFKVVKSDRVFNRPYAEKYGDGGWLARSGSVLVQIRWKDLPVDVAFDSYVKLKDERQMRHRNPSFGGFSAKKGESGEAYFDLASYLAEELDDPADRYEGKLYLVPDDERAYKDVALTEIWGGTFTIPFEFEVREPPEGTRLLRMTEE